ncbi:hypothetical protein VCRA2114E365_10196 [Vibrio crassostreae]|nr:hypothetical protein VCRA2115O371_10196 [Vibrio crassostreae]CAK1854241.1 hypothetical protein VCRA2113O362_10196 [Vibrio crassostreae]CAK1855615.1 hypothetical protein VCRA2113O354_10196 [Vibrio crassostreae]CAK1892106.1 hypothetical protein VCRA2113O322_10620 [Vibrio crassostreae]CAK1911576.1 hypothetical protein VCRA2113O326_10620 [Vibrio crassostreae]
MFLISILNQKNAHEYLLPCKGHLSIEPALHTLTHKVTGTI